MNYAIKLVNCNDILEEDFGILDPGKLQLLRTGLELFQENGPLGKPFLTGFNNHIPLVSMHFVSG